MAAPEGFEYEEVGDSVIIYHRGRRATVLRGDKAVDFLGDVESSDGLQSAADQELMARLTGNYKRGNEREARNHPRNRNRG